MKHLNLKPIAAILMAGTFFMPIPAEAQFLKGIKDKIKQTKEELTGNSKKEKKSESKSRNSSTQNETASGRDEAPKHVKGIHFGNLIDAGRLKTEGEQFYSASTPRIEIENGQWSASDYHDGVAYVSTWLNGNFFIDKNGNRLFETSAKPRGEVMPEFDNGVVMLSLDHKAVEIRDKKGNLIKSFDNVYGVSNFKNGIACIVFQKKDAKHVDKQYVKYVNASGELVYPDIWFECYALPYPKGCHSVDDLIREESEGLTAYPMLVESNGMSNVIKWGYHSKGKKVIAPTLDAAGDFHEGLAIFGNHLGDNQFKFGFIDKTGNTVIPAKYSNLPSDFNSGYSKVLDTKQRAYLIDKTGATRFGPVNQWSYEETEGEVIYVGAFAGGYGIIGEHHEGNDGIMRRYFFIIDKDFNKKAFFYIDSYQADNRIDYLKYVDGNYYIFDDITRGGRMQINPETADIIGVPKSAYMNEGVYLDQQSFDAKPGFRDKNGNYTLMLLQNEF